MTVLAIRSTRQLPALAGLLLALPALAEEISFDEQPAVNADCCYLTEEYADLGIHFVPSGTGATWDGESNGDPGFWLLEGTNEPNFLGLNSPYKIGALFDGPVRDLSVDVARGNGSSGQATVKLEGYREGVLVERIVVELGAVGDWQTLRFSVEIDELLLRNTGTAPNRNLGVDNLRWTPVSAEPPPPPPEEEPEPLPEEELEPLALRIDVRPFRSTNWVLLNGRGPILVALFGSDELPVADVDMDSLGFGPGLATPAARLGPIYLDLDRDDHADALTAFWTRETGLEPGDELVCLSGETFEGLSFEGCDEVKPLRLRLRRRR